jgi:hypothetical protein
MQGTNFSVKITHTIHAYKNTIFTVRSGQGFSALPLGWGPLLLQVLSSASGQAAARVAAALLVVASSLIAGVLADVPRVAAGSPGIVVPVVAGAVAGPLRVISAVLATTPMGVWRRIAPALWGGLRRHIAPALWGGIAEASVIIRTGVCIRTAPHEVAISRIRGISNFPALAISYLIVSRSVTRVSVALRRDRRQLLVSRGSFPPVVDRAHGKAGQPEGVGPRTA